MFLFISALAVIKLCLIKLLNVLSAQLMDKVEVAVEEGQLCYFLFTQF